MFALQKAVFLNLQEKQERKYTTMRDVLDVHTHTLASGHAYNTIREMAKSASEKGLELLGITEHAAAMPGAPHIFYFENMKMLDREMYGIQLLFGAELNILDSKGTVDLPQQVLKNLDLTVASLHIPCIKPGSKEENTSAYLETMKNPWINIIGHPDDGRYPVDYLALVQAAKEYGVLLEVNNNSLDPRCSRQGGQENVRTMLRHCMEYQVPVVLDSDAHTDALVGFHQYAWEIIREMNFPEELIVNRSTEELKKYVNKYKNL